jgi:hypothetical protein
MIIGIGIGIGFSSAPGVSAEIIAPSNLVAPAVTGDLDGILTCSTGTWTQMFSQTFTYQWNDASDDSDLVGETANTIDSQDHIGLEVYCTVTATNSHSAVEADSNTVGPLEEDVAPTGGEWATNWFWR